MDRLDKFLFIHNYSSSRSKAEQLISQKKVKVNGKIITKNSFKVSESDLIEVGTLEESKYVSRAALKLLTAFETFSLKIEGNKALDIGSSTGGFIQVLLEQGAATVYGIDVGHDQLHPILKEDARVTNFEKCNAREPFSFKDEFDLITCDVSFISVTQILPNLVNYLSLNGQIVFLLKPQFESKGKYLKNGVVPETHHSEIFDKMKSFLDSMNLELVNSCPSKIQGKTGNQEYLWLIKKKKNNQY
ncbi:TlyA family RNA methyltransferase [Bacteriovoracaceae bacterium]|nr:TlyA family RNA methyltransferase [Bacteriovoracaceae bacterium]